MKTILDCIVFWIRIFGFEMVTLYLRHKYTVNLTPFKKAMVLQKFTEL